MSDRRLPALLNGILGRLISRVIGSGFATIQGTLTADRSYALQDATGTVPLYEVAGTFTQPQTITASSGIALTLSSAGAGAKITSINNTGILDFYVTNAGTAGSRNLRILPFVGGAANSERYEFQRITDAGVYAESIGSVGVSGQACPWAFNGGLYIGSADPSTATAGNGLVQRASGTTRANGDSWGTDTFLYRIAANSLKTDGDLTVGKGMFVNTSRTNNILAFNDNASGVKNIRCEANNLEILNASFSTVVYQLTDAGNLSLTGSITSKSATSGVGYETGAGGTVTQATSKATAVTLSKVAGTITLNGAALASATSVAFTWTNTAIAATDVVVCVHDSVGTLGGYGITVTPAAGSATVTIRNNTAGSLSEAIVLRFVVIKAVTA